MAIIQDKLGKLFTPQEYLTIFEDAIEAKIIFDNNIPILDRDRKAWESLNKKPCPEWYRAFVTDTDELVKQVSGLIYTEQRGAVFIEPPNTFNYIEIEWKTASGSHFTLGAFNEKMELCITYNPDPVVRLTGIRTIRYINVR